MHEGEEQKNAAALTQAGTGVKLYDVLDTITPYDGDRHLLIEKIGFLDTN